MTCSSLIYSLTTSWATPAAHKSTNRDAVSLRRFPARAVSVLQSGCLESLLLRSLYTDRIFWESRGGVRGIRPLIRTVQQRGEILLQYVREKKMQLKSDLWMSRRRGRDIGDAVDPSLPPAVTRSERSSPHEDALLLVTSRAAELVCPINVRRSCWKLHSWNCVRNWTARFHFSDGSVDFYPAGCS